MNETSNSKTAFIKALAIIGFFVTIALVIWLVVQGLRFLPGSFASLASIAESLQNYRQIEELSIATEKSIVVSGESFKVTWTDLKQKGSYEFTNTCTDGVSVKVQSADAGLIAVPCTDKLSLPSDAYGLFMSVDSTKQRFTDVPFKITFKKSDGSIVRSSDAKITVVNATIPLLTDTKPTTTPEVAVKPDPKPTTPVVTPTTPTTPVVKPAPSTPTVVLTYPQSNPNGYTDLQASYIAIGSMTSNNVFTSQTRFDRSERNGLKFEVKNIGTKTSGTWTFKTTLPDGTVYESPTQIALKPSERVEFTLGFTIDDEDDNDKEVTIKTSVDTKNDTNSKNDSFSKKLPIKD